MPVSFIGARIRAQRKSKGLSQAALAKAVGISPSYLNLIEHSRRNVAGQTLNAVARELGLRTSELSEDPDSDMVEALHESAARHAGVDPEIDRLEQFVSRFPGWAKVLSLLFRETRQQKETLASLADRLNQDPFLRDTTHLFLTNITAIRSTAEILADLPDMAPEKRAQFTRNLHGESLRLSKSASELVAYFDNLGVGSDRNPPPGDTSYAPDRAPSDFDDTQADADGRGLDAPALATLLAGIDPEAAAVPPDAILSTAIRHHYNPVRMARDLGIRIDSAFFLLAHLPRGPETPIFGIIRCDGSGGVRYRRELEGLSLPKYASACPLWPIYRAFGQPDQPVRAIIETPIGDRFLTYSFATYTGGADFGLPGLLRSTMAYTNDKALLASAKAGTWQEPIPVGLQCAICPRAACRARREHYILDRSDAERGRPAPRSAAPSSGTPGR